MSNNDRFKFRVWDKKEEEYIKPTRFNVSGDGRVVVYSHDYEDWNEDDDDYILEQCTGLKDKNGKLIYEGDIVNLYPVESEEHRGRTVVWLNDHWTTSKKPERTGATFYWTFGRHEIEVVGNIHEVKE